jgi:Tfp pilus assembly protein PilX
MKKGFTLLLALIVSSVVLAVGLGIYSVIIREIELSGLGRESQLAFYAADSGVECVLYWDLKKKAISTTTPSTINCIGQSPVVGGSLISSFKLNFNNGACAKITINKVNPAVTQVDSYGYNLECDSVSSIKVERGVRVTY